MTDEQPRRALTNRHRWWMRAAWIVYWVVYWALILVVAPIFTFVPALGGRPLAFGVTLRQTAGGAVYVLAGVVIVPYLFSHYRNAWRTLGPAWWRWSIVGGLPTAVLGMAGAAVVALLHAQLGDAIGFPLYVTGICLSFAGIGSFGVGGIAMALASQRQQRANSRSPILKHGPVTPLLGASATKLRRVSAPLSGW